MKGARLGRAIALGATMLVTAAPAQAQTTGSRAPVRPEARVDYLGPDPRTLHAGLGFNVPVGTYLRLGVVAAGGTSRHHGRSLASARADFIGRFVLDPFRERQWGLSAGGGISARYDALSNGRRRWRPLVAVLLDLEGPLVGSFAPALQAGLGGGFRAGLVVRRAGRDRR